MRQLSSLVGFGSLAISTIVAPAAFAQAPAITTQPAITTYINEGQNATFTVAASGAPTLTYQWRRNGTPLTNGGRFAGVDTPTLTITGATQFEAGRYTAVVTNGSGSATSGYGYLAVRGPYWNQFPTVGTPPNGASPIAFDLLRDLPVVWTSNCGGDPMAGTWELQGFAWTRINLPTRPVTCARGYITYDPTRQICVQFGGTGSDDRAHEYDGGGWVTSPILGPANRFGHRMVGALEAGGIFMFGGRRVSDNALLNQLWFYNGTAWTMITPATGPVPPARQDFAMAYDPRCRKVVIFGGAGAAGPLADTWEYDIMTQTWAQSDQPTGAPSARTASTMWYYPEQQAIYMFGGLVGANFVNGSWRYDCNTDRWTLAAISNNPPAAQGYMTYDQDFARLILLQGDQTWEMRTYFVGCPSDFNGNNSVNTQDLFDFLQAFFGAGTDFNGDGNVNSQDFFDYLEAFFTPC